MRVALDPSNNTGIARPPHADLARELCAPKWKVSGFVIQVESREEIVKRIGNSPDLASAYILALMDTPKRKKLQSARDAAGGWHDPNKSQPHDPYR